MKKVLSMLLAFCMIVGLMTPAVPVHAHAEEVDDGTSVVETAAPEESEDTEPAETEPVETEPVETEPAETEPVETEPVETEPAETEPVETEPVETEPGETEPVETESVEIETTEETIWEEIDLFEDEVHIHADKEFTALDMNAATWETGNYYLTENGTVTKLIHVTGDVSLCLNGKTLAFGAYSITVDAGASLTICDCGEGNLNGSPSDAQSMFKVNGTLNLESGLIRINSSRYNANGVLVNDGGVFNMTGGRIENKKEKSRCLKIEVGGTANVSGGELVTATTDLYSRAVYVNGGTLNVSGDAVVTNEKNAAIQIMLATGVANISGGTITGATRGVESGTACGGINLSGKPVISGGECDIYVGKAEHLSAMNADKTASYTGKVLALKGGFFKDGNIVVKNVTKGVNDRLFEYAGKCLTLVGTDLIYGSHAYVEVPAKEATCTEDGNIGYWTCSVCGGAFKDKYGNALTEEIKIPALGHSFGLWTDAGDGENHTRTCPVCNETESEAHDWVKGEDGTTTCSVCGAVKAAHIHADKEFTALDMNAATWETGNYYLTENGTVTKLIHVTGDVSLCLNGKTLAFGAYSITVDAGASLTICDCGEGNLNGSPSDAQSMFKVNGTLNLESGLIRINSSRYNANGVLVNDGGVFNMTGGRIENKKEKSRCLKIEVGGTANVSGGELVTATTDLYSRAVYVNGGTLNVSGDAVVTNEKNAAIQIMLATGVANISGGTITGATRGVESGTACGGINLSGKPVISGGECDIYVGKAEHLSAMNADKTASYTGKVLALKGGFFKDGNIVVKNVTKGVNDRLFEYAGKCLTLVGTDLIYGSHAYVEVPAKEATCTEDGNIGYWTCSVCGGAFKDKYGNALTEEIKIPALGHSFGAWTKKDNEVHERACTNSGCSETQTEAHRWSENGISIGDKEVQICNDCGATKEKHVHVLTYVKANPHTCTEDGTIAYYICGGCGKMYADPTCTKEVEDIIDPATGHDWDGGKLVWAEDHLSATLTFTCKNDASHVEKPEVTVTVGGTEATCETDGLKTYTATAHFNGTAYVEVDTEYLPALGHDYSKPTWNWTEADVPEDYVVTATAECANGHTDTFTASVEKGVVTEPDCVNPGKTVYTATVEIDWTTYTDIKEIYSDALGHDWNEPVWTWHEDTKEFTADFTCKRNSGHVKDDVKAFMTEVALDGQEPTCEQDGSGVYVGTIELDGKTYTQKTEEPHTMPKLGHKYMDAPKFVWGKDNTTANGIFTCDRCGDEVTRKASVVVEILEEPTCVKAGKGRYTATVEVPAADPSAAIGDTYSETKEASIPALGHDWGEWKVISSHRHERTCNRCGKTDVKRFFFGDNPKTGDTIALWVTGMVLSAAAATTLLNVQKRKNRK